MTAFLCVLLVAVAAAVLVDRLFPFPPRTPDTKDTP